MHALIEADGLSKKFGKVDALNGPDPDLAAERTGGHPRPQRRRQDHVHPHGGHAHQPDRGTLPSRPRVVRDPMAVRRMIGLAGQSAAVEEIMTGRENL